MSLKRSLAALSITLFALCSTGAGAASLSFIPESSPNGLSTGDEITLQVWLDFSDVLDDEGNVVGTIGGGWNIYFDAEVLELVNLEYIPIGNPSFGRPPDIYDSLPGFLDSWGVGDFEGIIGPIMAGSLTFEVISEDAFETIVEFGVTGSITGGIFINASDFLSIIDTDYGSITLRSVPLPAGALLLLSSLGALLGFARRSTH